MPELDPFDARLEHAVHAFADRAQTSVDAAAVARQAIGRKRTGVWAAVDRSVQVPVPLLAGLALLVGFVGWSLTGGGPFPMRIWLAPVATPTAAPSPTPAVLPTPTPYPSPDGVGDEAVAGTEWTEMAMPFDPPPPTLVINTHAWTDDPRGTGAGRWLVSADLREGVGPAWGPYTLTAGDGTWDGTCTGTLWEGGVAGTRSCWLVGSGAHEAFSYYLTSTWSDQWNGDVRGVIVPGPPPSP